MRGMMGGALIAAMITLIPAAGGGAAPIDRHALVTRHNVVRTKLDADSPLQVGNGEFAFSADITGLQAFVPFNTMSDWGWHSFPLPAGQKPEDFRGVIKETHGRPVWYPLPNPDQPELSRWLYQNPNRLNLGRLSFQLTKADGTAVAPGDLTDVRQELNLWTGILHSHFVIDGMPVDVETACHPDMDGVAVRVVSPSIAAGRLAVQLEFPYTDSHEFANFVGDWTRPQAHQTTLEMHSPNHADFTRQVDDAHYHASLAWAGAGTLQGGETAPPDKLEIVRAMYGCATGQADVTAILVGLVRDGALSLPVNYTTLGDPCLGKAKRLVVAYRLNGEERRQEVPDNETLTLGTTNSRHRFVLRPGAANKFEFFCGFGAKPLPEKLPSAQDTFTASAHHWESFWKSGGAIDLCGSKDPRWHELERRIVLSEYLMAVNEAESLPPQESGLVNNGWWGKFHLEMYWWHAAHYALWNRWPLLNRSLPFYKKILPVAEETARRQGYRGARWPKCVGPQGRESPHPIHAWLIWQQPHPLFFAELDYRAHPTRVTLEKWKTIVFETADFMASYAWLNPETGHYDLGPPLYVVSENTNPETTKNPAFELAYWRVGLRLAQEWRERLGLARDPEWDKVLHGLAPIPEQDGLYVLHEGVQDMWTEWTFEHPALVGIFGWLPGDGVDRATMLRTLDKVSASWNFDHTWGWDFPMLAMCAARLGEPERAVDFLLHPAGGFQFKDSGMATGGPFPYFPSNGGLLYAVAMMAAGWDGAPVGHAPGFPDNGQWKVRWEGLRRAL